jgi:LysR family transcriptional regulator, glycine cleavage system transcriptional activator
LRASPRPEHCRGDPLHGHQGCAKAAAAAGDRPFADLGSLRDFEAVARHGRFTGAALELHVTQSAVSQRIRGLELELGARLYHRLPRGLRATDQGRALADSVRRGRSEIPAGLAAFDADAGGVLTMSALPSFASRWLVPRLARLQERQRRGSRSGSTPTNI